MIYALLPAYNEAPNIRPLLDSLAIEYASWAAHSPGGSVSALEAVVVDDGSADATAEETQTFRGEIGVRLLRHERNLGLAAALETGLRDIIGRCADSDVIVTMDADGTHHPRYIFQMIDRLQQGYDIVVASRFAKGGKEHGVNAYRKLLSRGARLCYRMFFPHIPLRDFSCGFRVFRAAALRGALERWDDRLFETPGFSCTGELMLKTLALLSPDRVTEIPFELHYDRKGGASKMPALKTIRGTIELLIRSRQWRRSSSLPKSED